MPLLFIGQEVSKHATASMEQLRDSVAILQFPHDQKLAHREYAGDA
jgi:hypothetical protein